MRIIFVPYNPASASVKLLREALEAKGIKHLGIKRENSKYKYRNGDRVINWGCSTPLAHLGGVPIINCFPAVGVASNKLSFFTKSSIADDAPRLPPWTTDPAVVTSWLQEGFTVCARKSLTGHSAAGLVIFDAMSPEVPEAPLYTRYVKKKDEYRIHIFDGQIIDVQRKALREGVENPNWKIRNAANGFVYVRGNVEAPEDVITQASKAMNSIGLDFGAVDVIWNEHEQQAYVLEINSAPGLAGTTVTNYVEEIVK